MNVQHKQLAAGRWKELSFLEQMANVGSEVERSIAWKNKGNPEYGKAAFHRALELLDLTVKCSEGYPRLKELLRAREALVDYFAYDNRYGSSDQFWRKYFYAFAYAARRGK